VDKPIDLEMLIAMTNNLEKPQDYVHQRIRSELELGRTTGK